LRGLSVGAPVTLFGLTVGRVAEVGLSYDSRDMVFRPRVVVTFLPERLAARLSSEDRTAAGIGLAGQTPEVRARTLRHLVEDRGLRAQLLTGSLLTGEMYVGFEYFPNAPKPKIDWSREPLELPVAPGGVTTIEAKLTSILTKIDNMPLDAMGADIRKLLVTLNQTLKDTDRLISNADAQWVPEGTKTLEELHRAIADADKSLLGKDSGTAQDLRDTLQELTNTARSVRVLVEYLERHPEMFIRGKKQESP